LVRNKRVNINNEKEEANRRAEKMAFALWTPMELHLVCPPSFPINSIASKQLTQNHSQAQKHTRSIDRLPDARIHRHLCVEAPLRMSEDSARGRYFSNSSSVRSRSLGRTNAAALLGSFSPSLAPYSPRPAFWWIDGPQSINPSINLIGLESLQTPPNVVAHALLDLIPVNSILVVMEQNDDGDRRDDSPPNQTQAGGGHAG
jgi:hypothetical protein